MTAHKQFIYFCVEIVHVSSYDGVGSSQVNLGTALTTTRSAYIFVQNSFKELESHVTQIVQSQLLLVADVCVLVPRRCENLRNHLHVK